MVDGEKCIRNAFLTPPFAGKINYKLSIGLHPWFVESETEQSLIEKLNKGLEHQNLVTIGEIGLDKLAPNYIKQEKYFSIQKDFASAANLPIIIHQVRSAAELGLNLKNYTGKVVLHGFTGHLQVWEQLNKNQNTYLSIGAAILKTNPKLVQTVKELPKEYLLLETDNSVATIKEVYEKIAEIKHCSMEAVCLQVEKNFKAVFTKY